MIDELLLPGAADGGEWLTHENQPPVFVSKYRFLDLRTGARTDPPGVADPKKTCTPPSFSADRSRLAYSDYEDPRRGHVYERAAGGWRELAAVPGENARLSPDGKSVATVGWAGGERASHLEVGLYTVPDGKKRWAARVDSYGLRGFTPDGRFVVQDDNAGRRLLDAATGRPTLALKTGRVAYHAGHVLALDPGGAAQPLTRWDAATGQELSRVGLAQTAADRDRTPPFGSPRLAVVRAWDRPASPADPARASVLGVTVRDPARPDWKAEFELTGAAEVLLLPDGKTLAAVESDGVSFYRLPD